MTPTANNTARYYRPELDVLRFGAFILVFLHHALPSKTENYLRYTNPFLANILSAFANSLGFGLCLFFFLSAYLITTLLLIEHQTTGTIHASSFYVRRILRIWPLYALGLAIGCLIALRHPETSDLKMFSYYAVFMGNWYFQHHPWSGNPMTQLWSISIEEQFYLILPLMMLLLGRRYLRQAELLSFCYQPSVFGSRATTR